MTSRNPLGAFPTRLAIVFAVAGSTALPIGCTSVDPTLRHAQIRAMQLHQQNQAVIAERDQATQTLNALAAEKARLEQQRAELESDLDIAHRRLNNLSSERSQLHEKYVGLLKQSRDGGSPLSAETTRRFEDLARRYPDFEFDPQTGVSKFHSDILFDSGSATVKGSAEPVIREFAQIMNAEDARRLHILVVGHTDDKPIGKPSTKRNHPTNWHLSTNRANGVLLSLKKFGVEEPRMGAAGYSMFQPVVPNENEEARSRNRRVEIFVLAPDALVAGWDPGATMRR